MRKLSTLWQMTLIAIEYLRGRKLRTALTVLAIVFGVALIFAMNLVLPSAQDALKRMVSSTSGAIVPGRTDPRCAVAGDSGRALLWPTALTVIRAGR